MKNKLTLCLSVLGLIALVACLAACGRTSNPGDGVITMPHDTSYIFENCLVCHAGGELAAPDNHAAYTTEQCSMCHFPANPQQTKITPAASTTPPADTTEPPVDTTEPPTDTTTPPVDTTEPAGSPGPISADNHVGQADSSLCSMCHPAMLPNPADHADYANDSCLDAGCHELP